MDNTKSTLQNIKYIFYILMVAILGWFLFMQIFGANEQMTNHTAQSIQYTGSFYWQKEDGSKKKITVPGKYEVDAGDTMVITTTLPKDYDETSFAIRSSLQDVKFYVGGKLRTQYSTKETRLAGKNSASRYIFCPTSYKDAGKTLRIELTTYTSNYSGVVNSIYCGDPIDIWQSVYNHSSFSTYIAIFILVAGFTTILYSIALKFVYHAGFEMEYFGWCMIMGAIWMLGESKMRQLLIPNASALASLCFVMIMLSPIPILLYANRVQNGKHERLYKGIAYVVLFNFAISSILYLLKIKDYIETLPIAQCILLFVFILVFVHLFQYIHQNKKYTSDYLLLVGLVIVMVCIVIEGLSVYFVTSVSGVFTGIGLTILLFVNIVRSIHYIQHVEEERRKQEIEKEQKHTEKMTLQMMKTLSTTMEAKDEYTRGHSQRVAQYAALIAQKLHLSQDEITNLKNCAYLYDLGKMGIPDQVLNKPEKLSEEELGLIRQHPIIGEDILKDIHIVPHLVQVTRSHHEHFDGSGYPDGLKGEEIPLYARIIAIADSYDAMHSKRIYRNALSKEGIREQIQNNAGVQFDPKITEVFLELLDDGTLESLESSFKETEPKQDTTIDKFILDVLTTIKDQEETINYDYLTSLPVRSLGQKQIANAMQKTDGCLVFLDMDNLKKINDIYGHKAGDKALKSLGDLLLNLPNEKMACRMGGDEFLLFLPEVSSHQATKIVSNIIREFNEMTQADTQLQFATLSCGMHMCHKNDTFSDCYAKADKALYYVKQNGKNSYSFYNQILYPSNSTTSFKDLKQIAHALQTSGCYSGALDLDYRDFTRQYEYIHQLMIRNHWNCYLVMITMETKENSLFDIEETEKAVMNMGKAIQSNIRKVDVCTRYSAMQYLIILFQPIEVQIPNIMTRIFTQYDKMEENHNLKPMYEYISMNEQNEGNA